MKLKSLFLLILSGIFCLSLAGCGTEPSPDSETARKDLAAMTDEQLIPVLLENYGNYQEPFAFSAEMSWLYRSGDTVIAKMEGSVLRNGANRALDVSYTVEDETKGAEYVYCDGICYADTGKKQKMAKSETDVASFFAGLYPTFGAASDYNFAQKDLLRSDNGAYTLVLSIPANGIADSADIIKPLKAVGNGTAPVEMSDFSDIYLTLIFSADGALTGQTLGFDCVMNSDGAETEGTGVLRFFVTSTDGASTVVSVPAQGDSYAEASTDIFEEGKTADTDDEAEDATEDSDGE